MSSPRLKKASEAPAKSSAGKTGKTKKRSRVSGPGSNGGAGSCSGNPGDRDRESSKDGGGGTVSVSRPSSCSSSTGMGTAFVGGAMCSAGSAPWTPRHLNDSRSAHIYNRNSAEAPAELFRKDLISAMKLPDNEPLCPEHFWSLVDPWRQEWERGVQVPVSPDSLPVPHVTLVTPPHLDAGNVDRACDFKLPKQKFIRLTQDDFYSPDLHQLSSAPARAQQMCTYDLDDWDVAWLRRANQERQLMGIPKISELTLEKVFEELERQCWANMQTVLKAEELHMDDDDSVICDVCRAPDSEEGNEMVYCDRCNICVHQACYGILRIPSGPWLCRPCAVGVTRPPCALCPNPGGAMKMTRSGGGAQWAHVACALWIPEVSIGCVEKMEPITKISAIPASRWSLVCVLCKEKSGACIQCSVKTCKVAYHVTCAFRHGLEMKAIVEDENSEDGVKLRSYCDKHSVTKKPCAPDLDGENRGPRRLKKDMSAEEKSQARALRLQQIEAEFFRHVSVNDAAQILDSETDVVDFILAYWKLKRRSHGNRPLLPPKTSEPERLDQAQRQDLERMKMFVQLRQDLERVRNLCYMVTRREKLARSYFKLREQTFHKQSLVLVSLKGEDVPPTELQAIRSSNHGPTIYDAMYSRTDVKLPNAEDWQALMERIAGLQALNSSKSCPKEEKNGLFKTKKANRSGRSNSVKKNFVNGSERCKSVSSVSSRSLDSSCSSASSADDASPTRVKKRNAVLSLTSEDGESDSGLVSPSDVKKSVKLGKGIYTDSEMEGELSAVEAESSSAKKEASCVRTKAAVKAFSPNVERRAESQVKGKKNKAEAVTEKVASKKSGQNKRGSQESLAALKNDFVPQRQAAKKASEIIKVAKSRNHTLEAGTAPVSSKSKDVESSRLGGKENVLAATSASRNTTTGSSNSGSKTPSPEKPLPAVAAAAKATSTASTSKTDFPNYVPQRQAAKKAAETIKIGSSKSIFDLDADFPTQAAANAAPNNPPGKKAGSGGKKAAGIIPEKIEAQRKRIKSKIQSLFEDSEEESESKIMAAALAAASSASLSASGTALPGTGRGSAQSGKKKVKKEDKGGKGSLKANASAAAEVASSHGREKPFRGKGPRPMAKAVPPHRSSPGRGTRDAQPQKPQQSSLPTTKPTGAELSSSSTATSAPVELSHRALSPSPTRKPTPAQPQQQQQSTLPGPSQGESAAQRRTARSLSSSSSSSSASSSSSGSSSSSSSSSSRSSSSSSSSSSSGSSSSSETSRTSSRTSRQAPQAKPRSKSPVAIPVTGADQTPVAPERDKRRTKTPTKSEPKRRSPSPRKIAVHPKAESSPGRRNSEQPGTDSSHVIVCDVSRPPSPMQGIDHVVPSKGETKEFAIPNGTSDGTLLPQDTEVTPLETETASTNHGRGKESKEDEEESFDFESDLMALARSVTEDNFFPKSENDDGEDDDMEGDMKTTPLPLSFPMVAVKADTRDDSVRETMNLVEKLRQQYAQKTDDHRPSTETKLGEESEPIKEEEEEVAHEVPSQDPNEEDNRDESFTANKWKPLPQVEKPVIEVAEASVPPSPAVEPRPKSPARPPSVLAQPTPVSTLAVALSPPEIEPIPAPPEPRRSTETPERKEREKYVASPLPPKQEVVPPTAQPHPHDFTLPNHNNHNHAHDNFMFKNATEAALAPYMFNTGPYPGFPHPPHFFGAPFLPNLHPDLFSPQFRVQMYAAAAAAAAPYLDKRNSLQQPNASQTGPSDVGNSLLQFMQEAAAAAQLNSKLYNFNPTDLGMHPQHVMPPGNFHSMQEGMLQRFPPPPAPSDHHFPPNMNPGRYNQPQAPLRPENLKTPPPQLPPASTASSSSTSTVGPTSQPPEVAEVPEQRPVPQANLSNVVEPVRPVFIERQSPVESSTSERSNAHDPPMPDLISPAVLARSQPSVTVAQTVTSYSQVHSTSAMSLSVADLTSLKSEVEKLPPPEKHVRRRSSTRDLPPALVPSSEASVLAPVSVAAPSPVPVAVVPAPSPDASSDRRRPARQAALQATKLAAAQISQGESNASVEEQLPAKPTVLAVPPTKSGSQRGRGRGRGRGAKGAHSPRSLFAPKKMVSSSDFTGTVYDFDDFDEDAKEPEPILGAKPVLRHRKSSSGPFTTPSYGTPSPAHTVTTPVPLSLPVPSKASLKHHPEMDYPHPSMERTAAPAETQSTTVSQQQPPSANLLNDDLVTPEPPVEPPEPVVEVPTRERDVTPPPPAPPSKLMLELDELDKALKNALGGGTNTPAPPPHMDSLAAAVQPQAISPQPAFTVSQAPPVVCTSAPINPEPVISTPTMVPAVDNSRHQLKFKIKGPFLDANYSSSSNYSNSSLVHSTPPVSTLNTPSASSADARRMRKKELIRQYWTQDLNNPSTPVSGTSVAGNSTEVDQVIGSTNVGTIPNATPYRQAPQPNHYVITIPKAVASMTSIPTKEDYQGVVDANLERKRKRERNAGEENTKGPKSRELKNLDWRMGLESMDPSNNLLNSSSATDTSFTSIQTPSRKESRRGRSAKNANNSVNSVETPPISQMVPPRKLKIKFKTLSDGSATEGSCIVAPSLCSNQEDFRPPNSSHPAAADTGDMEGSASAAKRGRSRPLKKRLSDPESGLVPPSSQPMATTPSLQELFLQSMKFREEIMAGFENTEQNAPTEGSGESKSRSGRHKEKPKRNKNLSKERTRRRPLVASTDLMSIAGGGGDPVHEALEGPPEADVVKPAKRRKKDMAVVVENGIEVINHPTAAPKLIIRFGGSGKGKACTKESREPREPASEATGTKNPAAADENSPAKADADPRLRIMPIKLKLARCPKGYMSKPSDSTPPPSPPQAQPQTEVR